MTTSSVDDPRCPAAIDEALALARPARRSRTVGDHPDERVGGISPRHRGGPVRAAPPRTPRRVGASTSCRCTASSGTSSPSPVRPGSSTSRPPAAHRPRPRARTALADAPGTVHRRRARGDDHVHHRRRRARRAPVQRRARNAVQRGTVDAGAAWLVVRWTLRFTQGRLGELVDQLGRGYARCCPRSAISTRWPQRDRRARGGAAGARRGPAVLHDYMWLILTTTRGYVAAAVGEPAPAAALYDDLLPFAESSRGRVHQRVRLGPVARALGRLAAALGRRDDARRHFEQAQAVACAAGRRSGTTRPPRTSRR